MLTMALQNKFYYFNLMKVIKKSKILGKFVKKLKYQPKL